MREHLVKRAQLNASAVMRALASVGQRNVAEEIGVHESTVSKWKGEDLERLASILAALDLKVVPVTMKCYRPEDIEPLIALARQRMQALRSADQLAWEDDAGDVGGFRG